MTQPARSGEAGPISYDEKRWPFVVVTLPEGSLSDEQLTEHLRDIDAYTQRGGRYGFVVDARAADPPSASQRRRLAESMDRNGRRDGARFVGIAIVLDSAAKRAVFKALIWLRQEVHPMTAVSSVEEGLRWLRSLEEKIASAS